MRTSDSYELINTLANVGMAFLTSSNFGKGLPLHKFESAHVPCLTVFLFDVVSIIFIKGSSPLNLRIKSLYTAQSPAILPRAQIAYSAISMCFEDNNLTNIGIPPLSMIV